MTKRCGGTSTRRLNREGIPSTNRSDDCVLVDVDSLGMSAYYPMRVTICPLLLCCFLSCHHNNIARLRGCLVSMLCMNSSWQKATDSHSES